MRFANVFSGIGGSCYLHLCFLYSAQRFHVKNEWISILRTYFPMNKLDDDMNIAIVQRIGLDKDFSNIELERLTDFMLVL